ncbi:hypothetical protein [Actinomycetospora sp. TBRC 11914]|uniref:hypothetical protein n=1 Tax=Actinomycetospora sp. TBRC 11914 TaxID=2729387 RepID=UPI00145CF46B|nr:hypothetical protein [Actinomycetospora sp. TBRC 11914]NMO90542.1 hypothetical protein [Actinomycetospora sp. TBRC 11914]
MTGEPSEGARRARVVPRPGPGRPPGGPGGPARPQPGPGPVDAETEVLPRVDPPGAPAGRPAPAPRGRAGHAAAAAVAAATGSPTGPDAPVRTAPDAGRADAPEDPDDEAGSGSERRYGMGTPALVLGLLAAGTCWTGWAGVVLGLFGVAAGYLGARRAWKGLATDGARSLGGLVLGAIGLVIGAVVVWPTLFGTGNFGDGLTLDQCLQQAKGAFQMHMCKSQHITEFNQRFPNAST